MFKELYRGNKWKWMIPLQILLTIGGIGLIHLLHLIDTWYFSGY